MGVQRTTLARSVVVLSAPGLPPNDLGCAHRSLQTTCDCDQCRSDRRAQGWNQETALWRRQSDYVHIGLARIALADVLDQDSQHFRQYFRMLRQLTMPSVDESLANDSQMTGTFDWNDSVRRLAETSLSHPND